MSNLLKLGICGWGNIATGLFEQLHENSTLQTSGIEFVITCIGARRDNPNCDPGTVKVVRDIFEVIDQDVDVVVELIGGTDTAKELIAKALNAGKHVITANKAVIFEHGNELISLAIKNNVELLFEAAVCAGTPIVKLLSNDLGANDVSKISGMLNGTSNFILSSMEDGDSYEKVLNIAKDKGYAEPDPSLDVNGTDAAHKIGILSALAFNTDLPPSDFYIEGIEDITEDDFKYADQFGYTLKHLAVAKQSNHEIELRAHPVLLPKRSRLSNLKGVRNGIQVDTNLVGEFNIAGSGAGKESTASGLISDLIALAKFKDANPMKYPSFDKTSQIASFHDLSFIYYLYLETTDASTDIDEINNIFSEEGVTLDQIIKPDKDSNGNTTIVAFTNLAKEKNLQKSLARLNDVQGVVKSKVIRIEE